ncbi:CDP-diacylglycerol--glycerol-3-phosphate 3-phosphatidyltransferase [Mesoterricola sediminis]|uniref:CDP-diacylglycerol--glycerol-3-phosphate 3-phosphatidyltransferase n=1 Tax=Mesoterricola sediminis TaxID=2927980 RepID=A0AA48KEX5_9BACT|nr:CDP-diacylglycerol--glycerol-3-phosphate 3-phosphatidyltransferase [Mesoterricola sediminis]BDU75893.1 CDP-alcohol phosphatidyltransferase [Mesoterricola sediminis]
MVMTFPNILTLLRICAVPFFAIAVWYGRTAEACLLFAAAGMTDLLDGWIARRFNQRSTVGAVLDPAADKLLMTTAFVMLAFPRETYAVRIPAWVSILAISRDVIISLVALVAYERLDPSKFMPSLLGKATTFVELVAISVALLFNHLGPRPWYRFLVPWVFYLIAAMVVASGIHYFFRATHASSEPA